VARSGSSAIASARNGTERHVRQSFVDNAADCKGLVLFRRNVGVTRRFGVLRSAGYLILMHFVVVPWITE
jgi:hypothetical protein